MALGLANFRHARRWPAMMLAAALAAAPPARAAESIVILGGGLVPQPAAPGFVPRALRIAVNGLPANWSAGRNLCHTVRPGDFPGLRMNFSDGQSNAPRLIMAGFALTDARAGTAASYVTLCRDADGAVSRFAAQLVFAKPSGGAWLLRGVAAVNLAPNLGSSQSLMIGPGRLALDQASPPAAARAVAAAANLIMITD